ncbi:MAG: formylglycine-generating enzyme family protein [Pirellulaceae bacterium]
MTTQHSLALRIVLTVLLLASGGCSAPPKTMTNSIGMRLNLIPAGEFQMGSPESEASRDSDEGPQHRVRITRQFYLGVHEVTQGEYERVMGDRLWDGKKHTKNGEDYAASYISWTDAVEFCKKLSAKEGRTYRLPTEAEWEYACRAGTQTRYHFGDDESDLGSYAWFYDNAWHIGEKYAHEVGQKRANSFGLYDMHGNVWEWCQDWNGEENYGSSPSVDPTGPTSGSLRVIRGGSWSSIPRHCRAADRDRDRPGRRDRFLGFRVALVPAD